MKCLAPISLGSQLVPCARCEPCRINRRRLWTNRIMLEALDHASSSFLTLTYSEENLPRITNGLPTLDAGDLRNWLKRIRKAVEPVRLRFYGVGEYGDESFRPHYHVALFGLPGCRNGQTMRSRGRPMASRCCAVCKLVDETWGLGDIDCGTLGESSAQYLAGYVLKKMTRNDDARLLGRDPEFARMSRRPGLGVNAMYEVASTLMELGLEVSEADVPSALRRGKRIWPLGRFLRMKLRLMVGKDGKAPQATLDEYAERLRPLREAALRDPDKPSLKWQALEAYAGDVASMIARSKIHSKKRGSL